MAHTVSCLIATEFCFPESNTKLERLRNTFHLVRRKIVEWRFTTTSPYSFTCWSLGLEAILPYNRAKWFGGKCVTVFWMYPNTWNLALHTDSSFSDLCHFFSLHRRMLDVPCNTLRPPPSKLLSNQYWREISHLLQFCTIPAVETAACYECSESLCTLRVFRCLNRETCNIQWSFIKGWIVYKYLSSPSLFDSWRNVTVNFFLRTLAFKTGILLRKWQPT